MTRRELADWLSRRVMGQRLDRLGEPMDDPVPFEALPAAEQQTWLDVAGAVLEYLTESDAISRLQSLQADWLRYTVQLERDEVWRDDMRRAVVVEMRAEVDRLARECGL